MNNQIIFGWSQSHALYSLYSLPVQGDPIRSIVSLFFFFAILPTIQLKCFIKESKNMKRNSCKKFDISNNTLTQILISVLML